MHTFSWPALAGLCFLMNASFAHSESDPAVFSREEALAYSQGVIGKTLAGVTLTAPDGRQVALEDFRGKPLVISLIFTSCHHICPSTTV